MKTKLLILTAVLVLAGGTVGAQFKLDVQQHRLDNGLTILLVENHAAPVMTYFTVFKVGARDEQTYNSGVSHFFEHMMFNGAAKYGPKMFDQMLESNGGYSNASTSDDITRYFEDFSSDILELVIDLESDRMASLALKEEVVLSERGVVREERLVGVDNDNEGIVYEELAATAFLCHSYGQPVIGWGKSIENFNRKDCLDYFHTYYAPNNAVVAIVGDFDSAEALKLLQQYFNPIPSGPPPPEVPRYEPEQRGAKRVHIERESRHPHLMRGYHVGDKDSPDLYPLEVFQFIMCTGESSRLYQTLVNDLQLALYQYGGFSWGFDPSLFYFYVAVMPDKNYADVEKAMDSLLAAMASAGPTADELARAKNSLTANFYKNFKTNNGTADQLATFHTLYGDYSVIYKYVDQINAVTAAQVQEVAAKYFTEKNSTTVVLTPQEGES